jgi:histidine phosphotransferase ChpT
MGHDLNYAALIGSRICHDLISPIGAINNGLELIEMSVPSLGPEMALISDSVASASARIRFFRIAFGAAADQMNGAQEVTSLLKESYDGGRLMVTWQPIEPHQRRMIRMTFLALMCLETAMPYGGRIEISHNGAQMSVAGIADKLKIDAPLWSALTSGLPQDELRPAHVQFGLLPLIAQDEGRDLGVDISEQQITIRI